MKNRKVSVLLPYYNRKKLLKVTLDSFEYYYGNRDDFEVVIVDDGSNEENSLSRYSLLENYNLNIVLVDIIHNQGINPCYPYNVAARKATGEIFILSSPEIFHIKDMFTIANNFEKLDKSKYYLFSVFCLVEKQLLNLMLDESKQFNEKLMTINSNISNFNINLGELGYPYNNRYGSWYTHSKHRATCLNFLSAMTKEMYYELSGFDERFRNGSGCDDEEFRNRILDAKKEIVWLDSMEAIHLDHEIFNDQKNPISNFDVLMKSRIDKYIHNDDWGKM